LIASWGFPLLIKGCRWDSIVKGAFIHLGFLAIVINEWGDTRPWPYYGFPNVVRDESFPLRVTNW
jgi:hypothetical protein